MKPRLELYEEYSREEAHHLLEPHTKFSPQSGTWGLQGVVPIADRSGDYAFFVTFGKSQAGHTFVEGVTRTGILSWQSQPNQGLSDRRIRQWIRHNPSRNSIYLFLRTGRDRRYAYLGRLAYLDHDRRRQRPVYFKWRILDWAMPERQRELIGLEYQDGPAGSREPHDAVVNGSSTRTSEVPYNDIKLEHLPQAFSLSTRLENWIKRAAKDQELPVETVGEYLARYPEVERSLFRSQGIGHKSVDELSDLIKRLAVVGQTASSAQEFCSRLKLSPRSLHSLLPQVRQGTEPEKLLLLSLADSPDEKSIATAERFRDLTFPKCMNDLPISGRLGNTLVRFSEVYGSDWSLADVLKDYSDFRLRLQRLRSVGLKTLRECSQVLCGLVIRTLVDAGYSANHADQIGRELCRLDSSQVPAPLPKDDVEDGSSSIQDILARLLSELDERSRAVVERRYGLTGPSQTLEEVGVSFGVTRERIRQVEKKAIGRLGRGRRALKASIDTNAVSLWRQVMKGSPVLLRSDLDRVKGLLPPEIDLAIKLSYGSLERWLSHFGSSTTQGWFINDDARAQYVKFGQDLKESLKGRALPVPLSQILPNEYDVDVSALFARGTGRFIHLGYVCTTKPGIRLRRAIQLHRILVQLWPRSASLTELLDQYRACHPDDQCSSRDCLIVMEAASHLFVHLVEDCWASVPRLASSIGDQELHVPARGTYSGRRKHDSGVEDSITSVLERLIDKHGPTRFTDLREQALKKLPKGTSRSSIGPILLTSGLFVRVAPGVYALPKQVAPVASGKVLPEALFAVDQCRWFAQAMRAGSPHGEFPAWNLRFEFELCRWAARNNLDAILFEALLAVVRPETWHVSKGDREYWARLKALKAVYRLDLPTPRLVTFPPSLERLAAVAQKALADGSINWMSVNRVLGKRIDSATAASTLAFLVAASVLKPADHWQSRHDRADGAEEFVTTLASKRGLDGVLEWSDPVGQRELQANLVGAESQHLGWVSNSDLGDLLTLLGSGRELELAPDDDDDADPLESLLAARRASKRSVTARDLIDRLADSGEETSE